MQLNETERAERFFERAVELDEKAATAYYGLGNLYFEKEDYQKASQKFLKAIEQGLEEADAYFMLGMCFRNQEQWKLSLPYLLRATELDSQDESFLFQYGLSLAQVELLDEAQKHLKKCLNWMKRIAMLIIIWV